jgi:hypothetical protein
MKMKIISLVVASIAAFNVSWAQVATTQYFMNSLPQYVTNNPAFIPKYKFALGLPGSMIDLNYYNNGFNYNNAVRMENGKRVADLSRLTRALPDKTYITTTMQLDLFRFGLKIGTNAYLSLNSTVRGYGRAMMPKDALALVATGNNEYVGRTMSVSPEGEMMAFWENSIGLAVTPVENLTVGARVKLLRGFVNTTTTTANATVYTGDYDITLAADMTVKSSGIRNMSDGFKLANYSGNTGFAFDLGATFKPIDKLTVAASLIDLGAIKWKNDLDQYTLDKSKANYTFSGFDIDKLIGGELQNGSVMDSLKAKFKPEELAGSAYSTMLPGKALISANYDVMKNFSVGTMFYVERFMGRVATGWSVGMNKHFGKILSTSLSYTVSNRSFNNLGAGLSLNFTPVQIYVVGDNLLRLPLSTAIHQGATDFFKSTQVFTLRAGVNFVWGWADDVGKDNPYQGKKKVKTSSDKNKHPAPKSTNL